MRPRKLRRRVVAGAASLMVFTGVAVGHAVAPADARTAVLAGTFGVAPKPFTCPTCEPVRYMHAPSQAGIRDGVRKLEAWMSRTTVSPEPVTVEGFSLGSHVGLGFIRDNPDRAKGVQWRFFGAPETPGNAWKGNGHRNREGLPEGDWSNVTFHVALYDPVADVAAHPNLWSMWNSRSATHTKGYDELGEPTAVYTDAVSGSVTNYYRPDVLPMLRSRDWYTSDERMAELDAKYRPLIEKAYDRPVDVEAAWKRGREEAERDADESNDTAASSDDASTEPSSAPAKKSKDSPDSEDSGSGDEGVAAPVQQETVR